MHRSLLLLLTVVTVVLSPARALAGVWLELLHAPCLTGNAERIDRNNGVYGRYRGAVDCFNKDFNGEGARTTLSIKAFQPWEYGTMFLYYDVTGPFNSANWVGSDNEKGGFFGGLSLTVSPKKVAQRISGKEFSWGPLADVSLKYEAEHVSKFGMLHYYGLQWDLALSFLDFLSVTTVVRDDQVFEGVDLQLGMAWQRSFAIASQDFIFGGFFSWGLFGEGAAVGPYAERFPGSKGNSFFLTQPQLLWDFGKPLGFTAGKLYTGLEWQLSLNRYLIPGKTENVLQGMVRWNI